MPTKSGPGGAGVADIHRSPAALPIMRRAGLLRHLPFGGTAAIKYETPPLVDGDYHGNRDDGGADDEQQN